MKEKEVNGVCKSTEFEYASHETGCHSVRTTVIDGELWFVATDVCKILGMTNVTMALESLDNDERGKFNLGRAGETNIISEPGLYSLIMRSRKLEAKHFKRWVTHEVLPTIRKTGGAYLTTTKAEELLADPSLIIGLAQQVIQLKKEHAMLANVAKEAEVERDHAIRTKAHISDKKTATAMGRLGGTVKKLHAVESELEDAKSKLGIAENYKQVRAIEWLGKVLDLKNRGSYVIAGKRLSEISLRLGHEIKKVPHAQYPAGVNVYHKDVVAEFKNVLTRNPDMLTKYRVS